MYEQETPFDTPQNSEPTPADLEDRAAREQQAEDFGRVAKEFDFPWHKAQRLFQISFPESEGADVLQQAFSWGWTNASNS